jgi:hypothetical protein
VKKKMLRLLVVILALCFLVGFAYAQDELLVENTTVSEPVAPAEAEVTPPPAAPPVEIVTLKGEVIDNNCADAAKPSDLARVVKRHTKKCALKPACVASGYAIYTDGQLEKFDAASTAKIEEFLKKPDSKLQVVVEAQRFEDKLSLMSIKNQD